MSDASSPRGRAAGWWLIALTAVIAIGSFAASAILGGGPAATRPHPPSSDGHPAGDTSPARDIERAEPPLALAARDRRLAARAARGFLSAFLTYEIAALTPAHRTALQRWSTPTLARALLARPPRPVQGATPARSARVRELALTEVTASRLQYLVNVRRGSTLESFTLTLTGRAGRWRVAAIGG